MSRNLALQQDCVDFHVASDSSAPDLPRSAASMEASTWLLTAVSPGVNPGVSFTQAFSLGGALDSPGLAYLTPG